MRAAMAPIQREAVVLLLACALACATSQEPRREARPDEQEMTLGTAQREIKAGMSQAEVAAALGSPNLVTKDADGRETWIYDKIASEASYSTNSSGTGLILGLFAVNSNNSGRTSKSERTLTVVIKFDAASKVQSMTYHASKF